KGENGFIITSADDRMPAVLGYSDNGAFNPSDASPELKWWLSQYAAEANACLKEATTATTLNSGARRSARQTVPELLSTRWDQGTPYNLDCPSDSRGRCVTGCVATAMAQVIKYFGYPTSGTGSYSYDWKGTTLHYDYAGATFDYQNMLDEYDNNNATQTQKAAVANLMYACGVGVNMNYSSSSSGASDGYVAYALAEYFNYDKSIRYLLRDCLSAEDWEDIVYAELLAGRPVIYGGQSNEGGHEFVCDGYEEGYFHINWGWSGYGNGWFLLSALDPGLQGIGGFAGGYNFDQSIICGIQPNAGNPQTTYPIFATGGLEVQEVYGNEAVMIGITDGGVWNYSPASFDTSFYLKAVADTGEEYVGTTSM
ncbi:MAG: C10 family peptidase, partial [Muribaculaceae bacterium]|nr:C10 family peptidase [Muribaculaceae bacterium]